MKAIAVDDEYLALEGCLNAIKKADPSIEVEGFESGEDAIEYLKKSIPDIAFLDVEMRGENGIKVAKELQKFNSRINIIFVTGYSEFMQDAFSLYASGYILKPVTAGKVKDALEHLRYPVEESLEKKMRIRTFGNFEVFGVDGKPVEFAYSKTKELLAVLIDANGAMRTFDQIMEYLWMDELDAGSHGSYLRNLFADMQRVFSDQGVGDALIRRRGAAGIDRNYFVCDYFMFLEGKKAQYVFAGEYMSQYSWGEMTLGKLVQMSEEDF
ncbi:response regulator [Butyrivibrio sp. NC2002]|uniref:response regulator n=1 Tax=Butyrivibrio sp. NC2002 TaxID=1410610 RepID=UPI0005637108|nr:response regulator [Butyrivibrio sp. NC2002]